MRTPTSQIYGSLSANLFRLISRVMNFFGFIMYLFEMLRMYEGELIPKD